jgi:hypothetical protein
MRDCHHHYLPTIKTHDHDHLTITTRDHHHGWHNAQPSPRTATTWHHRLSITTTTNDAFWILKFYFQGV